MTRKRRTSKTASPQESPKTVPLPRTSSLNSEPPQKFQKSPLGPHMTNIQPPPGYPLPLAMKPTPVPPSGSAVPTYIPQQPIREYQLWPTSPTSKITPQKTAKQEDIIEYFKFLHNPYVWGNNSMIALHPTSVTNIYDSFQYFPR